MIIRITSQALSQIYPPSLYISYGSCGKKYCWCVKEGKKHGPYYAISLREGRKRRLYHLPKEILPEIKEGTLLYKRLKKELFQIALSNLRDKIKKTGGKNA